MNGTPVMYSAFSANLLDDFVLILYDAALMLGPPILLQLLEMKPKFRTAKEFLRWLWNVNKGSETDGRRRNGTIIFLLKGLTHWLYVKHKVRWGGEHNKLGLKYVEDLDLTKWTKAVPDEELGLMYECWWISPERPVKKLLGW
jgi:hypothetical protein